MCCVAAKDARAIDCIIDTQLSAAIFEVWLTTVAEGGCGAGGAAAVAAGGGGGDERILGLLRAADDLRQFVKMRADVGWGLFCE